MLRPRPRDLVEGIDEGPNGILREPSLTASVSAPGRRSSVTVKGVTAWRTALVASSLTTSLTTSIWRDKPFSCRRQPTKSRASATCLGSGGQAAWYDHGSDSVIALPTSVRRRPMQSRVWAMATAEHSHSAPGSRCTQAITRRLRGVAWWDGPDRAGRRERGEVCGELYVRRRMAGQSPAPVW
jgi:hypothetical protein